MLAEDPREWRRGDFAVLWPVPTRWNDVDAYGHVNNAVHFLLMDTAVNAWLHDALGRDHRREPCFGVVAEVGCRYFGELDFPEPVDVGIATEKVGRTSVVYRLGLFGRGDSCAAAGRFVHVYVDRETRRPVPVPDEVRGLLGRLSPPTPS